MRHKTMRAETAHKAGRLLDRMRPLAARYYQLTQKPAGIAGELGEYDAARLLGLKLAPARTAGYDATDRNGCRVQIKTRVYPAGKNNHQRMGAIRDKYPCSAIVLLLLDPETLKPREIYKAPWTKVLKELTNTDERRDLPVPVFLRFARQVWCRQ